MMKTNRATEADPVAKVQTEIQPLLDTLTNEQITELGIGLICLGIFRESKINGKLAAAEMASDASGFLTKIHIDWRQAAARKEKKGEAGRLDSGGSTPVPG